MTVGLTGGTGGSRVEDETSPETTHDLLLSLAGLALGIGLGMVFLIPSALHHFRWLADLRQRGNLLSTLDDVDQSG